MQSKDRGLEQKEYYKEVDSLRALAVIIVVLFHLNIVGFKGGFVGVDIFFVISGYLITKLILDELRTSTKINYKLFFIRRIKRILPALVFTLFIAFYIAVFILNTDDFKSFSGSIIYALLGSSNMFFWMQAGYFDVSAELKPALHTWSLSVEAQFYFIWPFIIALLFHAFSRINLYITMLLIGVLSFILNIILIHDFFGIATSLGKYVSIYFQNHAASIFFLMPCRIFEFAIGAGVLWLENYKNRVQWSIEISVLLGLIMIFYATNHFNNTLIYPSYYALVPCFGTALILFGAKSSKFVAILFRNHLIIRIGVISYSLYLVHWPTIVFYKYVYSNSWSILDKIYVFVASIFIAIVMYRFIEQPFRKINVRTLKSRKSLLAIFTMIVLVFSLPALHAYTHNGWSWRFPMIVEDLLNKTNESLKLSKVRSKSCSFTNFNDFDPNACIQPERGKINILLMGDSVASYIWIGLSENLSKELYNILQLTPSNCRQGYEWGSDYCLQSNQFAFDFIAKNQIDLVIFASLGPDYNNFRKTIQHMKKIDKPVLIIGQPFIFTGKLTDIITKASNSSSTKTEIQEIARKGLIANTINARQALQKIAYEEGVRYFDIQEQLCRIVDDLSTCNFIVENSLITADNNHLTPIASIKIFKKLAENIRAEFDNSNQIINNSKRIQ